MGLRKPSPAAVLAATAYATALAACIWLLRRTLELRPTATTLATQAFLLADIALSVLCMLYPLISVALARRRAPEGRPPAPPSGLAAMLGLGRRRFWVYAPTAREERPRAPPKRVVAPSWLLRRVAPLVGRAGLVESPKVLVSRAVLYAFVATLACVPVAALLASLLHPLLFLVALAPIAVLLWPEVSLKSKAGERKARVEEELPLLAATLAVMEAGGSNMYDSMVRLIGKGVLPASELEARVARRNVEVFGMNKVQALDQLASEHPSESFADFIRGYTSEWVKGGDRVAYLTEKAKEFLDELKFRYERYAERASAVGDAMVVTFMLLPMMLVSASFIAPAMALSTLQIFTLAGVPALAFFAYAMTYKAQPKLSDVVVGAPLLGLALALPSALIPLALGRELWLAAAAGIAAFGAGCGAIAALELREVSRLEGSMPDFLRDVAELLKAGYTPAQAVIALAKEARYSPELNEVLRYCARELEEGRVPRVAVRSHLARMALSVLWEMVETGGGSAAQVELLRAFLRDVLVYKKKAKSSLRMHSILSFATPLMIAFTAAIFMMVMKGFAALMGGLMFGGGELAGTGVVGGFTLKLPPQFVDAINMLNVAASAAVAVTASKAVDYTAKSTLRVSVNASLAAAASIAFPLIL